MNFVQVAVQSYFCVFRCLPKNYLGVLGYTIFYIDTLRSGQLIIRQIKYANHHVSKAHIDKIFCHSALCDRLADILFKTHLVYKHMV